MAKVDITVCDGCGAIKNLVNHWFLISVTDGFLILPWSDKLQIKEYKHVCGHQCAHKLLDDFLQRKQISS